MSKIIWSVPLRGHTRTLYNLQYDTLQKGCVMWYTMGDGGWSVWNMCNVLSCEGCADVCMWVCDICVMCWVVKGMRMCVCEYVGVWYLCYVLSCEGCADVCMCACGCVIFVLNVCMVGEVYGGCVIFLLCAECVCGWYLCWVCVWCVRCVCGCVIYVLCVECV